ncbi:MAG: tyrosine-type recombinase/integrase [Candidatus Contendobacter sp.]|nr:tyrosine-type recombinase/integrase [Candidatus Contendobacter sp.]
MADRRTTAEAGGRERRWAGRSLSRPSAAASTRRARSPGRRKAAGGPATGTDRRVMLKKAGIEMKILPHKLRHTYATNLLNAGAELVDIKALLGHESVATTQIYTNVGQEQMEQVVARL